MPRFNGGGAGLSAACSVLAEIASVSDPNAAYVRGRLAAARSYRAALLRDREVMLRVLGDAILTAEAEIRLWEGRLSVAEGVPGDRFTDWPVSEGEVPALTTAPPDPLPIPYPAR